MTFEEFGKFLNRTLFISFDSISGARLVRIVYLLGLGVAIIWGLDHFFASFRFGFWDGIWGLVEIAVFGLFGITVLRMICEALIVYFETNKDAVATTGPTEVQASLIDEVRDAIEQLGEEGKETPKAEIAPAKPASAAKTPAAKAAAANAPASKTSAAKPKTATARRAPRTAKRSPKPKAGTGEG